jgi:aminomethyltransferase
MTRRVSALADHHRALGAGLGDWNGMDVAWHYASDPNDEHDAVREAAGLFDVSGLKKVFVRGADAAKVVDHVFSRDMTRIQRGKSAYGAILNEAGDVCDDAIIFNLRDDEYLFVHGSGEAFERLSESAEGRQAAIEFDDTLHDISLQGPKAVDFLGQHTPFALRGMPYFHHVETTLFGHRVLLSRTGYSGERGYEIFCRPPVVIDLWEAILDKGRSWGIRACSFTCIDKIRVEAALLFYPYDMNESYSPWEVGFGWAIARHKAPYRGRDAALAKEAAARFALVGIVAEHTDAIEAKAALFQGERRVGTLNSPAWSHRTGKSLALAQIERAAAAPGSVIEVRTAALRCAATVARIPFHDPEKTRTHAP